VKANFSARRLLWLLWMAAFASWIAAAVFPLSNQMTRLGGVILLFVVWLGLIGLLWQRIQIRVGLLALTGLCVIFLVLPARAKPDRSKLRGDYIAGLSRYERVPYYWGGESFKGIDCSGLIRRGFVDALFCRGIRSFDPGLVRESLNLWWHDCSARALGQEYNHLTVRLFDTPSINALDHSRILPGDIAVTESGVHVMAYLGDRLWIEADPSEYRVIRVRVPSDNTWFIGPMKIMRWNSLQQ
jgi:hypothetical protein